MSKNVGKVNFVADLENMISYKGQIAHVENLTGKSASEGKLSSSLPDLLESYLQSRHISLWTHQAETIEAVRAGENVILTTSTASGKTLAFNLPTIERLIKNPFATALYLYPTKALANDQLNVLKTMEKDLGLKLDVATYDGDTSPSSKSRIRLKSRLVVTNPYGLHEYMPSHHLWERFYSQLSIVVIDEAHWYRGIFGSNVALVIRRLRRLLAHYGANPQFVLASGTIANPGEHAKALTGLPHRIVSNDGAPHGPKEFILWDSTTDQGRSPHLQASDLLAHFASNNNQVICFTISRKMAELVARWARDSSHNAKIVAYRAGYSPTDRRKLEEDIRQGRIQGVASTNALELGVNIGQMNVVIMAGYPGTICSMWQQSGRAGRGLEQSLTVLLAFDDPLNQYFIKHPEELFGMPLEHAVVNLSNAHILRGQLLCASYERPLSSEDVRYFGSGFPSIADELVGEGLLSKSSRGYVFQRDFRPTQSVRLNNADEDSIMVFFKDELLETLSPRIALAEVHKGAIFLHHGSSYLVDTFDWENKTVTTSLTSSDLHTETLKNVTISNLVEKYRRDISNGTLHFGQVKVSEDFYAYRLMKYNHVVNTLPLQLPKYEMETMALWLTVPDELANTIRSHGRDYSGGLHAAEHAMIHMMPLLSMCDRHDVGGQSTERHVETREASIFIYDGFRGGIGIAEKAYEQFEELVDIAKKLMQGCRCGDEGCPSCIYDRNCGNGNAPMDKIAATEILESIMFEQQVFSKGIVDQ